jgi:hypothetical protein
VINFLKKHPEIILSVILFCIPLIFWGKLNVIIFGHDSPVFFDPQAQIYKDFFSIWSNHFNGVNLNSSSNLMIDSAIYIFSKVFGFPAALRILYSIAFTLPFLSCFYLLKVLFKKVDLPNPLGIISPSLFFCLNYFVIQRWHEMQWVFLLNYGLTPIIVLFYYRYVTENKIYLGLISLLFLFLNSCNLSDPPIVIGFLALMLLFSAVYAVITKEASIKRIIILSAKYIFIAIVLNSFVLFPLANVVLNVQSKEFVSTEIGIDYVNLSSQKGSVTGLLRQINYFLLYNENDFGNPFYITIADYLNNPIFISSIFYLILISLIGLMYHKEKLNNLAICGGGVLVIGLCLSNGTQSPTGPLFRWLFNNIPFFWMFRSADNKFFPLILFAISLLMSIFLLSIKNKKRRIIFSGLSIIAILIYSSPLLTGEVPQNIHKISVPDDYKQVQGIINHDPKISNVLFTNNQQFGYYRINNALYSGGNFLTTLFNKGIVTNPKNSYALSETASSYNDLIFNNSPITNPKQLGMFSIKYTIENKNLIAVSNEKVEISNAKKILENNSVILNKLPDESFVPVFYHPKEIVFTSHGKGILPNYLSQKDLKYPDLFVFDFKGDTDQYFRKLDTESSVHVEYNQINPTLYKVNLLDVSNMTPLVFTDSYSNGWSAFLLKSNNNFTKSKIEDQIYGTAQNNTLKVNLLDYMFGQKKPIKIHLLANGYANAWIIDPKVVCLDTQLCQQNADGTYNISLIVEYTPQKYFYIALSLSLISLLTILVYLIRYKRR